VEVRRLAAAAQPLPFLDYLLEDPVRAAIVDGGASSVAVPDPARFALHKLITAGERPAVWAARRDKDLAQAAQVLEALVTDRPGDVTIAAEALVARGSGWTRRVSDGLRALERTSPDVVSRVRELSGL
jgi:hypothetical protein